MVKKTKKQYFIFNLLQASAGRIEPCRKPEFAQPCFRPFQLFALSIFLRDCKSWPRCAVFGSLYQTKILPKRNKANTTTGTRKCHQWHQKMPPLSSGTGRKRKYIRNFASNEYSVWNKIPDVVIMQVCLPCLEHRTMSPASMPQLACTSLSTWICKETDILASKPLWCARILYTLVCLRKWRVARKRHVCLCCLYKATYGLMEERADHSVNKLVSCNNCLLKQSLLLHGFTSLKTFPGAQRA